MFSINFKLLGCAWYTGDCLERLDELERENDSLKKKLEDERRAKGDLKKEKEILKGDLELKKRTPASLRDHVKPK